MESELPILSKRFDTITILPTQMTKGVIRPIPDNVLVRHGPILKPSNILGNAAQLFDPRFWKELPVVNKRYRLTPTILIIKQLLSSLYVAKQIAKVVEELLASSNTPSIAYSYWSDESAVALALVKSRFPEVPMVCRAHGWDIYFERRNTRFISYRHLLLQQINHYYSISEQGLSYMKGKFPDFATKMSKSYLGVQRQINKISPYKPASIFTIVSASNMIPLKRIDLMIEGLALLQIPVEWIHFGDGTEKTRIIEIANEKLRNIQWELKGQVKNEAILAFYQVHNPTLFINVSSTEGLPVSIMEAMAHGIPVIATDVGGTGEIVQSGYNGILLPANPDPILIAQAIHDICQMTADEYHVFRENAFDTWQQSFNAELNFHVFADELLHLIHHDRAQ